MCCSPKSSAVSAVGDRFLKGMQLIVFAPYIPARPAVGPASTSSNVQRLFTADQTPSTDFVYAMQNIREWKCLLPLSLPF